jgi:RNA methyltransferase, TrmH family
MNNSGAMKTEFLNISQAQLKKWARLADGKYRRQEGIFSAEGVKVAQELLTGDWPVEALLVLPQKNKYWEELTDKVPNNFPVYSLTRTQWQKLSQDKEPEGIMAIVRLKPEPLLSSFLSAAGHILIVHEIGNPLNLGSILRSALWFGFNGIVLSTNSVDYTHPKAVRTSMGSLFHLTIASDVDLMEALPEIKKTHYLVGSDVKCGRLPHFMQKKVALLLGSESHGLPDYILNTADESWNIPGNDQADSLSLPQAAAIMMYACVNK